MESRGEVRRDEECKIEKGGDNNGRAGRGDERKGSPR